MSEVRRVCRQTVRWASIEGGRCRSDCSVLPHVVPETARSSSAGLVQPVGSASVRLRDAAETDPTRPLLVELHQMLS